ncbi:MAG: DUF192 domain-containing protein [Nanoarchaeota archaeon]|nr:DUF192 domain-containing protein [Nanoarchaeota archaeon]
MEKRYLLLLVLILLIIITISTVRLNHNINNNEKAKDISKVIFQNNISVNVELSKTSEEHEKGLMFREKLDENSGMLFIFEDDKIRDFWMKNTLIPLDIIFIDKDLKIVKIAEAIPCEIEDCPIYSSDIPARYVLELSKGYCKNNDIGIGDKIILLSSI